MPDLEEEPGKAAETATEDTPSSKKIEEVS